MWENHVPVKTTDLEIIMVILEIGLLYWKIVLIIKKNFTT